MNQNTTGNITRLCGTVDGKPAFSHISRNRSYFTFPLRIPRLSGTEDVIIIICDEEKMKALEPDGSGMLRVTGELRSYNNKSGVGNKLVIFVYAAELEFCDGEPENLIHLRGTLCKPPQLRMTPLGREICDLLLAVNRPFGRSDYLPCIAWGQNAREASLWQVGEVIELEGRVQSRGYIKNTDQGQERKIAYEISASAVERVREREQP